VLSGEGEATVREAEEVALPVVDEDGVSPALLSAFHLEVVVGACQDPASFGHGSAPPEKPSAAGEWRILLAYHEHRAVGVPDHRFRNTAHQGSTYGAKTPATYNDRPCAQLLA
jgi:hypothetical protein